MTWDWITSGPWRCNNDTDTEWKYEIKDLVLYIAFQGSTSRLDWLQNFSFWKKPYKNMDKLWFAHAGFLKKWKSVEQEINDIMVDNILDYDNVIVFGFSQGAAVALLCHEWVVYNWNYKVEAIVYGCPRVFAWSGKIRDRLKNITRYETKYDVVTKFPPWVVGYAHVGHKFKSERPYLKWWQFKKNHMAYGRVWVWK